MNVLHSFFESLYNRTVRETKLHGSFVCLFFCLGKFTLFVYKSILIFVENFKKYHLTQNKKR